MSKPIELTFAALAAIYGITERCLRDLKKRRPDVWEHDAADVYYTFLEQRSRPRAIRGGVAWIHKKQQQIDAARGAGGGQGLL